MARSLLCPDAFLSPLEIDAAVSRALAEDLGRAGDITATATIPEDTPARAIVVARAAGVISGLALVAAAFAKLAPEIEIAANARDGSAVAAKTALMAVAGPARAVLSAERVALNLLGRLSGVATATHEFVRRVAGTRTRICCTRKTTPGLRALEKYAVRCGGGFNHRFGLDDAMLIKDNHIAVAGGIAAVLKRARAAAGHLVKVEIEVDTLDQLREVLEVGLADAVLLDNMDVATMRKAVEMVGGKFPLEASGGITLDTIAEIAKTGVDYASSGWITHSAPQLDVALDIISAFTRVHSPSKTGVNALNDALYAGTTGRRPRLTSQTMATTTRLPLRSKLFRRFHEPLRRVRRRCLVAPFGRVEAVAPGARSIEGVDAELVHLGHFAHPARMHPVRVIVRGFADLGQPEFAVEHFGRDGLGPLPHVGLAHDVGNAVAGERELAVETAVGVLVDDTADRVGIFAGEHAVEYHLRHRHLAAHGFAAGFEIDRLGQAFLRLGATCVVEAESLGRGHRPLVLASDLALGRDRLSSAYAVLDHHARIGGQRRQIGTLDRGVEDGAGLTRGKRHGRHRR